MISDAEYAKLRSQITSLGGFAPASMKSAIAEYEAAKAGQAKVEGEAKVAQAATKFQQGVDDKLAPITGALTGMSQTADVVSNVDPAFRNYQLGLAQQLQAQATGQGPSIAQMQLKQATDRTLNQSLGLIQGAVGANAGLAGRTAAMAGAQQMGSAANASGILRLQEQQDAQNLLAGVTSDGRTADIQTDSNGIQAQASGNATRLGALGMLTDVAALSTNPLSQIYQVGSEATAQDKDIAFRSQQAEIDRAAQRDRERKARSSKYSDAILGAVTTGAATGVGTLIGGK